MMIDDLVIERVLAQDDRPAKVNIEILKGDREQVSPV
jgi:hypothetical protein